MNKTEIYDCVFTQGLIVKYKPRFHNPLGRLLRGRVILSFCQKVKMHYLKIFLLSLFS